MQKPALCRALPKNLAVLQDRFGGSDDFYTKKLSVGGIACAIVLFTGISSPEKLCRLALDMLDRDPAFFGGGPGLCEYLLHQSLIPAEPQPASDLGEIGELLANGMSLLLIDGCEQAVVFSTQEMLVAEIATARCRAKTEYCLCYDSALAPPETIAALRARLAQIELPVLLDSAYFASFLKQDKLNLFPAAAYTERPATACARLCEGKAVVLVAGSPYAMVVPSFFAEHFECLDDYASGAVFAGLIRLLKYLAFLLSVFGPGLYVMAVAFAPEIIPVQLLTKLAQAEAQTPLPPMLEMLAVTLLLEIVREAGLRAPQSISHTVSIVGALIIGETAVDAGIVSVPVLTMAAAATIATLAVPSLYEQSILFRFCVILLAGLFGVLGLTCAALMILAMACGSEPFGYDYLYPLMPPGKASVRDGFVRSIWSELAKAGEVIGRHEV